jgi:hypothetical protein
MENAVERQIVTLSPQLSFKHHNRDMLLRHRIGISPVGTYD